MKHLLKTFAVLMMATVAFCSCTKEKEPTSPQQDNRKPLAMRDNSGKIISLVDVEKLQAILNANTTKDDQFVIESYSVTDKTADDPFFFTISFIDVNEGQAYSASFIGDYIEEVSNYFYITDAVKRGNTGYKCPNGEVVKLVDGKEVEPEPCYLPPGLFVICAKQHCTDGSCTPIGSHGEYTCSACIKDPNYEGEPSCSPIEKEYPWLLNGIMRLLGQWF